MDSTILISAYLLSFALLTYRAPKRALALIVFLLPTYLVRIELFGIPTTLLELTITVVAAVWFLRMVRHHGWPRLPAGSTVSTDNPFHPVLYPLLAFLLTATVSAILSPNIDAALGAWKAYFIDPMLLFTILVIEFRGARERIWLLHALGGLAIFVAMGAWLQYFTGYVPEPYASAAVLKFTSVFPYPNAVGLLLAPIIALYIPLLITSYRRQQSFWWSLIVVIFGVSAIVLSQTKGAWLGVAISTFVAILLVSKNRHRVVVVGAAFLFVGFLAFVPTLRLKVEQSFSFSAPSGAMRLAVWEETVELIKDHPITGAGLANYQQAVAPYHVDWRPNITPYKIEIFLYPHNLFLNAWVELGLAGLLAFVWLLAAFFVHAWPRRNSPVVAGAIAAMLALVIHGLVDVPYFKNDLSILFWVLMALPLLETRRVHVFEYDAFSFSLLSSGRRRVDPRLLAGGHERVREGDILLCYQEGNGAHCVRLAVESIRPYASFDHLVAAHHPFDLGFETASEALLWLATRYQDHSRHYGVAAFHLRLVP
ncbi:MAG: O-antigen ligase family protein [Patescibacteria group bacterium]